MRIIYQKKPSILGGFFYCGVTMAKTKSISAKLAAAGGRGARSATYTSFISLSLDDIEKRMAELAEIMNKYEDDVLGYYAKVPGTTKEGYDAYRAAQSEYGDLLNAKREIEAKADELKRKDNQDDTKLPFRPFVNGFGEATTRHITTATYERAQRQLEKEVLNFLGRR